jgi:tetratricopeptide (TPR) repeat protein
MERSKCSVVFILIAFCFTTLQAANKSDIYQAYISGNMTKWVEVIDEMQMQKNKSSEFRMELINYQYGYIAWCLGNNRNSQAKKYLKLAGENLDLLEKSAYKLSLVNSYKAAFYGFAMGLNNLKAPFLGPKSLDCAKLAMSIDENNPLGYVQYANTLFYTPEFLGGSKKDALECFKKALTLMERDKEEIKNDWNYLNLLTIIAQSYEKTGNNELAKACYQKIITIEPNYGWVKNELYPQFLKKIKNSHE